MKSKRLVAILLSIPLASIFVLGATSALNNNIRIFEDTIWLITFILMVTLGILMRRISGGKAKTGYMLIALTGVSGLLWKGIGLIKRVFILSEPKWLLDVARETFEGLTGIILAVGFILVIYSYMKIFKKK